MTTHMLIVTISINIWHKRSMQVLLKCVSDAVFDVSTLTFRMLSCPNIRPFLSNINLPIRFSFSSCSLPKQCVGIVEFQYKILAKIERLLMNLFE